MSNTKYNSLPGAKPHPAYGTPPLDTGRGRGWGLFLLLSTLLLNACVAQDDKEVLFSDTELAIIKTLIYKDAPLDSSNNAELNANAAALGRKFFWDPQFSGGIVVTGNRDGSSGQFAAGTPRKIACVTCHDPNFGWADPQSKPNNISLGANLTERNSPTVFNAGYNTFSLWDGATDSVWAVMRPAMEGAPHNFSRLGVAYIICRNGTSTYLAEYTAVFGAPNCSDVPAAAAGIFTSANNWGRDLYTGAVATNGHVDRIFANFGKAIGAYERLIVSKNSAFDRFAEGADSALTASQKRGLKVFIGKGNCVRCHNGPNFSDGKFHNLGVPQVDLFSTGTLDFGRTIGISRVTSTASNSNGFFNTASAFNTNGAPNKVAGLTATAADEGTFKTPTLRSVNRTPPYFHNGSVNSLWDVVNFYNFAGNAGNFPGTKDPILTTRRMTNEEMEDLVNFLKALEGEALPTSVTTSPGGFGTTLNWP